MSGVHVLLEEQASLPPLAGRFTIVRARRRTHGEIERCDPRRRLRLGLVLGNEDSLERRLR